MMAYPVAPPRDIPIAMIRRVTGKAPMLPIPTDGTFSEWEKSRIT